MARRVVTITGGSGFLGQLLRPRLEAEGWTVRVFDPYRGRAVDLVRRRFLATQTRPAATRTAIAIRRAQVRAESLLMRTGAIRPTQDDILADPDDIAARLRGSEAVIHLAGIPHPHQPGATVEDFQRINYDGSVGVFAAARAAGVRTFVFASSAQVYRINDPVWVAEFPIPETSPLPLCAEGQTAYGFLKAAFERHLAGRCTTGETQAIALRLEFPGFQSRTSSNHYISTSVENVTAGFACALRPPDDLGFAAFNIADAHVAPDVADVQEYLRRRWPYVPNRTAGNQCLLSTELAQRVLGYRPLGEGRYVNEALVW